MNAILNQGSAWLLALVWDSAWKSMVLLAAAGAMTLAMRRCSAAARHLVWSLAMAGSLSLARGGTDHADLGLGDSPHRSDRSEFTPRPGTSPSVDCLGRSFDDFTAEVVRDRARLRGPDTKKITTAARGRERSKLHRARMTSKNAARPPVWWPVIVWTTGVMVFLAIPFLGRLALLPIVRSAGSSEASVWRDLAHELAGQLGLRRVRFLRSDRAVMPMTWGLFKPVDLAAGRGRRLVTRSPARCAAPRAGPRPAA